MNPSAIGEFHAIVCFPEMRESFGSSRGNEFPFSLTASGGYRRQQIPAQGRPGLRILAVFLLALCDCRPALMGQEFKVEEIEPREGYHWRNSKACGVTCTYYLLRSHGISVSYSSVMEVVPVTSRGSNIQHMASACEEFGLPVSIDKIGSTALRNMKTPFIAHSVLPGSTSDRGSQAGGHFVVVYQVSDSKIGLFDPSSGAMLRNTSIAEFLNFFTGWVLVPQTTYGEFSGIIVFGVLCILMIVLWFRKSTAPIALFAMVAVLAGCDRNGQTVVRKSVTASRAGMDHMVAWKTEDYVGLLSGERLAVASYAIQNTGQKVDVLQLGAVSCKCTNASLSNENVEPGETATLTLTIGGTSAVGLIAGEVEVHNKEGTWRQVFRISGHSLGLSFGIRQHVVSGKGPVRVRGILVTDVNPAGVRLASTGEADPRYGVEFSVAVPSRLNSVWQTDVSATITSNIHETGSRELSIPVTAELANGSRLSGSIRAILIASKE